MTEDTADRLRRKLFDEALRIVDDARGRPVM
jgi:hypothetical protein